MVVQDTEVAKQVSTIGGAVVVDVILGMVVVVGSLEVAKQLENVEVYVKHSSTLES
jgi:hypothetical protein